MYILISIYNHYGDLHFNRFLYFNQDLDNVKQFLEEQVKLENIRENREEEKVIFEDYRDYLFNHLKETHFNEGLYCTTNTCDYLILKYDEKITNLFFGVEKFEDAE